MKRLLVLAAVLEASTGLALMVAPAVVARLLLGAELTAPGAAVGRVAGCALIALGLACWPGGDPASLLMPGARSMLTYNALVACYLAYLGIGGESVGVLLWPAVAIHGLITLFLVCAWTKAHSVVESKPP